MYVYIYICDKRKYKQNSEVSSSRNHAVVPQKKQASLLHLMQDMAANKQDHGHSKTKV